MLPSQIFLIKSEVEKALTNATEYYREINDHSKCIDYMSCMEEHYSDEKHSSDTRKLRCEMAQEYEKAADAYDWSDPSSAHIIIGHIHSAMNMWSRANVAQSSVERQRLAKRIQPVKQLALEKMQCFQSDPIDLSSSIESMRELIQNSSLSG